MNDPHDEEVSICEAYNKELNERAIKRPVTKLITCPKCKGSGAFLSAVCWPETWICDRCYGKKYINLNESKESNILDILKPLTPDERKQLCKPRNRIHITVVKLKMKLRHFLIQRKVSRMLKKIQIKRAVKW
jgi:hypothetical protein